MLGLGDYESSGDEDTKKAQDGSISIGKSADTDPENGIQSKSTDNGRDDNKYERNLQTKTEAPTNVSTSDPFIGPTMAVESTPEQAEQAESQSPPLSPYSAQRAAVRKVTLPPIPNFDIPPSPPGSPSQATTAKFERFLELKAQGIHFNEKLKKSSALRNPGLFQKLINYAGISEEDQYCSTLPEEIAVPTKFPDWASPEGLAKAQQQAALRREEEIADGQRTSMEFVPANTSGKASVAERIIAGLNRDGSSTRNEPSRTGERRNRDGRDASSSKVVHR